MSKAKYLKIVLIVLALILGFVFAKSERDFEVFLNAGEKIISGQNIYRPPFALHLQYYYSPLFALLLSPVTHLPIVLSETIWGFLSCIFLYQIWRLSLTYFDIDKLSKSQKTWWLILSIIFTARFIRYDMTSIQVTIFLTWATLQSLYLIDRQKNVAGTALLALAINIKLLPLPFLIYLLYRKKVPAFLLTCVFYACYLYLPAVYLGWERNNFLLGEWFSIINPNNKEWIIEADNGPSSLVALIPVYLTATEGVMPLKRNFVELPYNTIFIIVNAVRLLFVVLTLSFLRTSPFKEIDNKKRLFWERSYLFIVVPLLFPHQQRYAFIFMAPALIYIAWYLVANWQALKTQLNYFTWTLLIITLIHFTPLIGRDIITSYVYELFLHYRVLTLAGIGLVVVLWCFKPKQLSIQQKSPA